MISLNGSANQNVRILISSYSADTVVYSICTILNRNYRSGIVAAFEWVILYHLAFFCLITRVSFEINWMHPNKTDSVDVLAQYISLLSGPGFIWLSIDRLVWIVRCIIVIISNTWINNVNKNSLHNVWIISEWLLIFHFRNKLTIKFHNILSCA